jgi:prophage tail gpP-like protein
MRLERKGIFDEEAYKRMTHVTGKRKKTKTKRVGKSYGKNKK